MLCKLQEIVALDYFKSFFLHEKQFKGEKFFFLFYSTGILAVFEKTCMEKVDVKKKLQLLKVCTRKLVPFT